MSCSRLPGKGVLGTSAFWLLGSLAWACSSGAEGTTLVPGADGSSSASPGGGGATSATDGGSHTGGSSSVIVIGGSLGNPGGAGSVGNGTPETCDGVDNDGNGVIDDVDAGNDGICDCLNIATLGQIGPWSNGGNVFATWLNARSPIGAVALDDQVLTEALLAPFQVIVSLHVGTMDVTGTDNRMSAAHHAFSDAETQAFGSWVQNGGGAMTTIGYHWGEADEVVNVNRLLATVGMAYSATNIELAGFVTTWAPHPVTMGISNIKTENGVEPGEGGTLLASGSDDRVALKVTEAGRGKVVVWGDEWITYDSEWQDVTTQQVQLFWVNILKWLSPPNKCQVPIPPTIIF